MRRKNLNHNKGIMLGIIAMAVVVLGVVMVFWMWCFPGGTGTTGAADANTRVLLAEGFRGDSVQLSVDDTLFFAQRVEADSTEVSAGRPEDASLLMVAFPEKDMVCSFDLPKGVKRVVLRNRDGDVDMEAF